MHLKIKICGMKEGENILEVASLEPDFIGFIFYPESSRYVGSEFSVPENFPKHISKIGVFVNESVPRMIELARKAKLDYIQLHGYESVEKCALMRSAGFKIIKAFPIDETFDFDSLRYYADAVDYFLFDTKGRHFGGNARVFDWNLLKQYTVDVPYFLSGGLSLENIDDLINLKDSRLFAVDVNSGVEITPGIKDKEKIIQLLLKLKTIDL